MMVLWEKKCVNVKELGECLYLDSGTLTPLFKKLESKGLLTRARSEKDERNLVVTITGEGEKLKEKAVDIPLKSQGAQTFRLKRECSYIRFRTRFLVKRGKTECGEKLKQIFWKSSLEE